MDAKSTHILDLPNEILLRILERVVRIKPDAYANAYPVDVGYFRLRHVCRRFRAVLRNKPHLSSLGKWHERKYAWPLLEQAHAYDEKNEAGQKLRRAEWLTKREAARRRSAQNSEGKQESLSHSSSFLTSGSRIEHQGVLTSRQPRRCERGLGSGHPIKECRNQPRAKYFSCCGYWGRHHPYCHARHCSPLPEPSNPSQLTKPQSAITEDPPFPPKLPRLRIPPRMPPKPVVQSSKTPATLRLTNSEHFSPTFLAGMEPLMLRPEDFAQKWAEIFEDVPMTGEVLEQTVRTKMRELKDCLFPQLLGTWLYVLGHTCKLMRQKQGYRWKDVVQHYHSLIARIIQSEAYSHFMSNHLEDQIFLEGVALWAGHDYSDPFGSEICYFVNTYQKAVVRKKEINLTYK
jgi:hypothetical protein